MALPNGVVSSEFLHAQAHVWNHVFNFINSMSLKCATQLGIPDIILKHGKPMTLQELVDSLPNINKAKAHGISRLMRILTHSEFFIEEIVSVDEENMGYWLTPASHLLLKDGPYTMAPFLLAMLDPFLTRPWDHVSEWFKTELSTSFEIEHGRTLWEYAGQEPRMNNLFNEAMASDARFVTDVLIRDCKHLFEGLNSMVDLAGGTGNVAKAISDAFPNMKCTVLDLPHVVAGLEGTKNLCYFGGDMFESIPPADAILLKWVLHDWNDQDSVKILKKCREAIRGKGGKVIIVEMVVRGESGDDKALETQLFFDMLMLVDNTGKERNEKEWAKLFYDAGFTHYNISPILGLRSLIEVYP